MYVIFVVSLQSEMKHFALIGRSLTHSYSKEYFDAQHFTDADYNLCALSSLNGLRRWVEEKGICGFNVTVPYKQAVIPFLDALNPEAEAIGAVNCVVVDDGRLIGHNTDAPAFRRTLKTLLNTKHLTPASAFILGTGGAARAVAYALGQLGIPHTFVSRQESGKVEMRESGKVISYHQLPASSFQLPTLIVNATPVGMYPDIDSTPLSLTSPSLPSHTPLTTLFVYDLVYNPSPTLLMRQAAALGAQTKDGLEMLHLQAELSWHLWHLK